MTKDALIDALEGRRPEMQRRDKRQLAVHTRAEKAWEKKVKDEARAIIKMSYAQLSKRASNYRFVLLEDRQPQCPISLELRLDRALRVIRLSTQRSYVLDARGRNSDIYDLLTYEDADSESMC